MKDSRKFRQGVFPLLAVAKYMSWITSTSTSSNFDWKKVLHQGWWNWLVLLALISYPYIPRSGLTVGYY